MLLRHIKFRQLHLKLVCFPFKLDITEENKQIFTFERLGHFCLIICVKIVADFIFVDQ